MTALRHQKFEIDLLGPLVTQHTEASLRKQDHYVRLGLGYEYERERAPVDNYAHQIEAKLKNSVSDIVFSPGTLPLRD